MDKNLPANEEDPTCHRATKPMRLCSRAQEKPLQRETGVPQRKVAPGRQKLRKPPQVEKTTSREKLQYVEKNHNEK